MIQKLAWIFAVVFLAVGVLGFVPGITSDGMLLGIFEVDMVHNIIHLVSGAVFAYAAMQSAKMSKMVFKVFGVIYAIVAVVGLMQGDTVLGLIATNMADHVLHVILAVAMLYIGFGMKEKMMATPMV
ncbi:MAG: DUF4383 domain-containing protein [Patescibacteria group bacterium]